MFSNTDVVNITSVLPVQYSIPSADWWSQKLWIFCLFLILFFLSPRCVSRTWNSDPLFSILACTSGSKTCFFFLLTEVLQTHTPSKEEAQFYVKCKLLGAATTMLFWLESCGRRCSGTHPSSPKHAGFLHHPMQHECGTQGMKHTGCYRGTHI